MEETVALEVELLKAAAEDALARGFAIMACKPLGKEPWPKYSPHACNSATRDPKIALLPWVNGEEANYGVSCGPSNITVVDCDHGLENVEQFEAWKKEHGVPETFTVISGRDGFGVHMYFSGAVKTCGFKVGEVTGELKGLGGYVVGPGSIHPSGKKYVIYKDVDVAPLPLGFVAMAEKAVKTPLDVNALKEKHGGLIPAGNRWATLESVAGKLRNAFLSEEGIYSALKDFAANNCEDGENYPDEKIKEIAHAATTKFDALAPTPVVFFGGGKKISTEVNDIPELALEGDWISDLSHQVTDGTFIPLSFARAQIKTILGSSIDELVGFPGHADLRMKHWTMIISAHPESGKGMSWKRTGESSLANYIVKTDTQQPLPGLFSSGEHMVKYLSDYEGKRCVTNFDEMKFLFDKGAAAGSTLLGNMTKLYDREDGSAGSLTHKGGAFSNVSLSLTGGFTRSSFESSLAGKGQTGEGFMSRVVLAYSGAVDKVGEWPELDTVAINSIAEKMLERWKYLSNYKGLHEGKSFIPLRTEGAKAKQWEFQEYLNQQKKILFKENPGVDYLARLDSYFKRDLLLRAIFSGDGSVITEEMVERSIAWAKHELYLRTELWPVDKGNLIERMEQSMVRALKKHENLTKSQLQTSCNVFRAGSGGMDTFNRAWTALLKGGAIRVAGKTHKNTEVFVLGDDIE